MLYCVCSCRHLCPHFSWEQIWSGSANHTPDMPSNFYLMMLNGPPNESWLFTLLPVVWKNYHSCGHLAWSDVNILAWACRWFELIYLFIYFYCYCLLWGSRATSDRLGSGSGWLWRNMKPGGPACARWILFSAPTLEFSSWFNVLSTFPCGSALLWRVCSKFLSISPLPCS